MWVSKENTKISVRLFVCRLFDFLLLFPFEFIEGQMTAYLVISKLHQFNCPLTASFSRWLQFPSATAVSVSAFRTWMHAYSSNQWKRLQNDVCWHSGGTDLKFTKGFITYKFYNILRKYLHKRYATVYQSQKQLHGRRSKRYIDVVNSC